MGNSQGANARDSALSEPVSSVELVCSARTFASTLDEESGSLPVIVAPTLRQVKVSLFPTGSGSLPITADEPARAMELMLRALQEVKGIEQKFWTQEKFVKHVPDIDIVHKRRSYIQNDKEGSFMATSPVSTVIRMHFQDQERVMTRFIDLLREMMRDSGSVLQDMVVQGFPGRPRVRMKMNFAPTEATVYTEAQLVRAENVRTEEKSLPTAAKAGAKIVSQIGSLGSKLRGVLKTVAPLLESQGVSVPDLSDASPTSPEGLADMLGKAQPALEALQKLGLNV